MKRNSNYRVETVNAPEDLLKFEGWEIRKVHAGDSPGIILQNPDTGERCKLIISWRNYLTLKNFMETR